jgi:hypothetical protein
VILTTTASIRTLVKEVEQKVSIMFKEYIVVILLHLVLVKDTKAKEDVIKMEEIRVLDNESLLDKAIGNCAHRPTRWAKLFSVNPPVSLVIRCL